MSMRRTWWVLLAVVLILVGLAYALYFKPPPEMRLPGKLEAREITWDTRQRSYVIYTPSQRAAEPALVFVFHASDGDAEQIRMLYGYAFEELAEKYGFIVIYPQGYERHWNGCRKAGPYAANILHIDDVSFVRALAGKLEAELGADRRAVFATGVSNGGQMALRLGLEAPDLVAAVAPIATSLPSDDNMDCKPSGQAVAFLLMNGTDDPMNPYNGGTVALYGLLGDRGNVLSSIETAEYFAQLAGYEGPPSTLELADTVPGDNSTVVVTRWQDAGKKPVDLYTIIGGGHNAPHPQIKLPRLLGGTNNDITAAHEIWRFFQKSIATDQQRYMLAGPRSQE